MKATGHVSWKVMLNTVLNRLMLYQLRDNARLTSPHQNPQRCRAAVLSYAVASIRPSISALE